VSSSLKKETRVLIDYLKLLKQQSLRMIDLKLRDLKELGNLLFEINGIFCIKKPKLKLFDRMYHSY
jgi:hypothetical protein